MSEMGRRHFLYGVEVMAVRAPIGAGKLAAGKSFPELMAERGHADNYDGMAIHPYAATAVSDLGVRWATGKHRPIGRGLPMRNPSFRLPAIDFTHHDFESEALVVRTDFSDDEAWRTVVGLLNKPDERGWEVRTYLVDDRAFAGAGPDDVLSAAAAEPALEVVFLADAATMTGDHTLLAVSTGSQELEDGDIELNREFRLFPPAVNLMHVNLAIAHMDFWEFAYNAALTTDGVLRL